MIKKLLVGGMAFSLLALSANAQYSHNSTPDLNIANARTNANFVGTTNTMEYSPLKRTEDASSKKRLTYLTKVDILSSMLTSCQVKLLNITLKG